MVELDFTAPTRLVPRMFDATSNGLASGNTIDEATLHALCELVERHALHEMDAGRLPQRAVGLGSQPPDYLAVELDRVRAAGMKVGLWSITWLEGMPTFVCRIVCREMPRLWTGSGCHPSPAVAASRAITEAVQSRLTWIAGARDDIPGSLGPLEPDRIYRDFDEPTPELDLEALDDGSSDSIETDLGAAVDRLIGADFTPYRIDLTREEIGVPVVYAFAPGLEDVAHG
jgi:ribosomal protein S12 methylthiotransferase accessory factor